MSLQYVGLNEINKNKTYIGIGKMRKREAIEAKPI